MQEFRPDCTINLHLETRGRPAKYVWACSLVDRSGRRLVSAVKFAGLALREAVLLDSAKFGLEQAQRLRMEKVELASEGAMESYFDEQRVGVKRQKEIQSLLGEVLGIWAGFRLRKYGAVLENEREYLRQQAETIFRR